MTVPEDAQIVFNCQVAAVKTMADGGIRVWLNLPEGAIIPAAALMKAQQLGLLFEVTLSPVRDKPLPDDL